MNIPNNPLVSIVILNYNAGDLLLNCISSIIKSNYKNFEIILVDNLSHDNSHKKCVEYFPEIKLVENKKNLGYCEGNNVGIRICKGELIVILNPDTIVVENWLSELISAYKKYGDGFYQPKFLSMENHSILLSTGQMIQIFGFGFSRSKGDIDIKQHEKIEKIDYASGTCLLTSMNTMKKIGMFQSFLFAFHDDLELCWRGRIQGISSYYVPKSIVYHPREGYSFKWNSLKFKLMERNRKFCLLTLYDRKTLLKMIPALFLVDMAVSIFYLSKGIIFMKISADFEILKNIKLINKIYEQNKLKKIIPDKVLIQQFKSDISVPKWVVDSRVNNIFSKFLTILGKFVL